MSDLDELIQRLEKATGPDRELDIAIASAWKQHHSGRWSIVNAPYFTSSIDAALTLVPEGWFMEALHQQPRGWLCYVGSRSNSLARMESEADTAAIALCIAALRARKNGGAGK